MCNVLVVLFTMLCLVAIGALGTYKYLSEQYAAKAKDLLARAQAAEVERLKDLRQRLEDEHKRKLAAVRAAEAMLQRGAPTDISHAGVSHYQRNAYRQGAFVGEHIRVIYLLSTDGFLTLRWEVDWPGSAEDPMVRISRDRKAIRSDWGRNGEHKEHVRPGGYTYRFSVHSPRSGNRVVGKRLLAEIVVPTYELWESKAPGGALPTRKERPGQRTRALLVEKVGAFVAAERAVGKMRQEVEKALRKQGLTDDDIEHRMSRLDGRIAEIREDIGA